MTDDMRIIIAILIVALAVLLLWIWGASAKRRHLKDANQQLELGLSRVQVIAMLGDPDASARTANGEQLKWKHRDFRGAFRSDLVTTVTADFDNNGILVGHSHDQQG
jgi:hypothetical protein